MATTAFLALDYIVDITHPSGRIARAAAQVVERDVIARANRALALARSRGWLTVLVKVGFAPGYPEWPERSPIFGRVRELGALALGETGTAFHPDLDVQPADVVLVKPRVSPFYATGLEALLRARGVERLVIAGVSTSWAVQAAARDAHDRDYQVVIVEDACAAATAEEHRASMSLLAGIATVLTSDGLANL